MPVGSPHSLAKKEDAAAQFSLTPKMKGVKTQSFFDSFRSFSGWCGVRGSSEVTFSIAR
jgi:hypothetical protein